MQDPLYLVPVEKNSQHFTTAIFHCNHCIIVYNN